MHNVVDIDQINLYHHLRKTSAHNWQFNIVFWYFLFCVLILNGCWSRSVNNYGYGSEIEPQQANLNQSIDCDFDPDIEALFQNIKEPRPGLIESGGYLFALLVGIDKYNSPMNLPDLYKPENEITQLSQILTIQGYNVKSLIGEEATIKNVNKWLECFGKKLNLTDRLLFYFAGHAKTPCRENSGFFDLATKMKYCKQDNKQNKNQSSENSDDKLLLMFRQANPGPISNFMEVDEIARQLNDTLANQKIMIIDVCYSGNFDRLFHLPLDVFSHRLLNDGFFALTGAKRTVEDGLIAPILFEALDGQADKKLAGNRDGFVSLYETTIYVDHEIHRKKSVSTGEPYKSRYIFVGSGEVKMTTVP